MDSEKSGTADLSFDRSSFASFKAALNLITFYCRSQPSAQATTGALDERQQLPFTITEDKFLLEEARSARKGFARRLNL